MSMKMNRKIAADDNSATRTDHNQIDDPPGAEDVPTPSGVESLLTGGGEMGERIRTFPWSQTQLGSIDSWSTALSTTVRILLANRFPILLWWGPEYISI
jgi:hypothetical protein